MLCAHVPPQEMHHRQLKDEVYPGVEGEQGEIEHDGARVKRQDVGPFHQGQTSLSEFLTQGHRDFFSVVRIELVLQLLETGSHLFLRRRVAAVEEKEGQLHVVRSPTQGIISLLEFSRIVEFAPLLPLEEIEVDVAIVISQLALLGVANET